MAKGYLLSESDKRILSALIEREKRKPPRQVGEYNRLTDDALTPEVYLALTPVGGIPGLVEGPGTGSVSMADVPGYADCDIHAVEFSPEPTIVDMGFTRQVLNLNTENVPGDHWVLVERDKFGKWYVAETYGVGSGLEELEDYLSVVEKVCPTIVTIDIPAFDADNETPTSGNILVGNGTTFNSVPISGDAALDSTGALTLTASPYLAMQIFGP